MAEAKGDEAAETGDVYELRGCGGRLMTQDRKECRVHPGTILHEDFLEPRNLTPYDLARAIGVSAMQIDRILRHRKPITIDVALRLGRYFNTEPSYWMRVQAEFDIAVEHGKLALELRRIQPHGTA